MNEIGGAGSWESTIKVFVSSVMNPGIDDLRAEREAVKSTIAKIGPLSTWMFEDASASAEEVEWSYLNRVVDCNLFVLIIGSTVTTPVEREYDTATMLRKPTLVFLKTVSRDAAAMRLCRSIAQKWVEFESADDLAGKLFAAIWTELSAVYRAATFVGRDLAGCVVPVFEDVMGACHRQVTETIQRVKSKYDGDLYVLRTSDSPLLELIHPNRAPFLRDLREISTSLKPLLEGTEKTAGPLFDAYQEINEAIGSATPLDRRANGALSASLLSALNGARFERSTVLDRERTRLSQLVRRVFGNFVAIVDTAGRGKTNLMCHTADAVVQNQPALLFSGRLNLSDGESLLRAVPGALGFDERLTLAEWYETIDRLMERMDTALLVFLDGVNEQADLTLLKVNLDALARMSASKRIFVVVTCRDLFWSNYILDANSDLNASLRSTMTLGDFTSEEFEQAWAAYSKRYRLQASIQGEAIEKLKHPLMLRFFCEAYGNAHGSALARPLVVEDIRLRHLFEDYWTRKVESIRSIAALRTGAPVEEFILSIACAMRRSAQRTVGRSGVRAATGMVDLDGDNSVYTLVLSEDIIIEEGPGLGEPVAGFVYDEFMEWVMAREIWRSEAAALRTTSGAIKLVLRLCRLAPKYTPLYGAVGHLAILINDELHFDVWRHVLSTNGSDKASWHQVAARSISQLDAMSVDDAIFETVLTLASSVDPDLRERLIDVVAGFATTLPAGSVETLEAMIRSFAPDGARLRAVAVLRSMASNGESRAVSLMLQLAEDRNPGLRALALYALDSIPKELRREVSAAHLNDWDPEVRCAALYLFLHSGGSVLDPEALLTLTEPNERALETSAMLLVVEADPAELTLICSLAARLSQSGHPRASAIARALGAAVRHVDWVDTDDCLDQRAHKAMQLVLSHLGETQERDDVDLCRDELWRSLPADTRLRLEQLSVCAAMN